jgi:glycosyltransferase involved in cell wall biosynthesis
MENPLVTVVTPTWGRPETIFKHAIPSIEGQTYKNIEHLIVTDGFDRNLKMVLAAHGYTADGSETSSGLKRRLTWLGRNWFSFSGDGGVGITPRIVGAFIAAGDLITYLDDDNDFLPEHIEKMVNAFREDPGLELAGSEWSDDGNIHGVGSSFEDQIDASSFMHRPRILTSNTYLHDGYCCDRNVVSRWVNSGIRWKMIPGATMILHGHRIGAPD